MLLDDKIKILFDGLEYEVGNSENLVEAMDKNGVHINAPCFRNGRKNGCCKACIVEVDGIKDYACGLKPEEGMNIVYNRDDLKEERKVAAKKYSEQTENVDACCGSKETSTTDDSCCEPKQPTNTDCGCNSNKSVNSGCC